MPRLPPAGLHDGAGGRIAPPLEADQVVIGARRHRRQRVVADHAPIGDPDDALHGKALADIREHFRDRAPVLPVALKHVRRDRPAAGHHDADQHLPVTRPAIPGVPVPREVPRPVPFEVRARQIEEDNVDAQAKQIPQPRVQLRLELRFGRVERIQCPIPLLQLPVRHADPPARLPHREDPVPLRIGDEALVQPPRQSMLAARVDQPMRDQHEAARGYLGPAYARDDLGQPHLVPQLLGDGDGAVGEGSRHPDGTARSRRWRRWAQELGA